jgi:outer membrane receptor for ferrienterochelin and colicins
MVLIDGMPIVSGLSTVYGLTGIPQSLIERVEIVKGPASTLYGSEAVGGLINIITKKPATSPLVSTDIMGSSWGELNADIGLRYQLNKSQALLGINYFNYQNPIDNNSDGFTDITLQHRISLFNKIDFKRKSLKPFSIASRYVYEDRWGGEMNWTKDYRGGDEIYGESIYTSRWELLGTYELPFEERLQLQFSANAHRQNSVYGTTNYQANQMIGFSQLSWNHMAKDHDIMLGIAYRYTFYDDNTAATSTSNSLNNPSIIHLPGIFIQDEIKFDHQNKLLLGMRYDYNSLHKGIISPRINYKWNSIDQKNIVRFSIGNGYRVANVFTEDHAALTGAREVIFTEELKPETSWNANLNFVKKTYWSKGVYLGIDSSIFYTHFNNAIFPDYETNPNQIIYENLEGYAVSKGVSINIDLVLTNGLKLLAGGTLMDVSITEGTQTYRQLLTERFSGVWNLSYNFNAINLKIDYTANLYGPMKLPLLGPLDDRPAYSKWYSLQNIQFSKPFKQWELYTGVKNLLNFTPPANSIARPFDPFDKQVEVDINGQIIPSPNNPKALSFDPTYIYAPNQGIRLFAGIRYQLNR